jgi:hypothetical protein
MMLLLNLCQGVPDKVIHKTYGYERINFLVNIPI